MLKDIIPIKYVNFFKLKGLANKKKYLLYHQIFIVTLSKFWKAFFAVIPTGKQDNKKKTYFQ